MTGHIYLSDIEREDRKRWSGDRVHIDGDRSQPIGFVSGVLSARRPGRYLNPLILGGRRRG